MAPSQLSSLVQDDANNSPASAIYQNDSILLNICRQVEQKKAVLSVMQASKRAFGIGSTVLYEEVDVGISARLAAKSVAYYHLMIYLSAIRTVVYPSTQTLWPNAVDIGSLSSQYPLLSRIKFTLPECQTPSIIELHTQLDATQAASQPANPKISGGIHLALDGKHGSHFNLYAEKMAVCGSRQKFHLISVRAGKPYRADQTDFPSLRWHNPPGFLYPGGILSSQSLSSTDWTTLLGRVEEISITNGCTGRQMGQFLALAPNLRCVSLYQFSGEHTVREFPAEGSGYIDAGAVLRRILKDMRRRTQVLDSVVLGADAMFYPELSHVNTVPPSRHVAVRWDIDKVYEEYQARTESVDCWRANVQAIEHDQALESLSMFVPSEGASRNPLVAGLALSKLVPPRIKIHFCTSPAASARTGTEFSVWVEHVKEARLYGIELLQQGKSPGFRQIRQAEDIDELASSCHISDTESVPDSQEGGTADPAYWTADVNEKADAAWVSLGLDAKLRLLGKAGIEVVNELDEVI